MIFHTPLKVCRAGKLTDTNVVHFASDLPGPDGTAELGHLCKLLRVSWKDRILDRGQTKERITLESTGSKPFLRRLKKWRRQTAILELCAREWVATIVLAKRAHTCALFASQAPSWVGADWPLDEAPLRPQTPPQVAERPTEAIQEGRTWRLAHLDYPVAPHPVGKRAPMGWRPASPWAYHGAQVQPDGRTLDLWSRAVRV